MTTSATKHLTADDRAEAVRLVAKRIAAGVPRRAAQDKTAAELHVDPRTVRTWVARALEAEAEGFDVTAPGALEAAMAGRKPPGRPSTAWEAPGADEAWLLWRKAYLRLEAPTAASCWEMVRGVAVLRGWRIPSCKTFLRRLQAEVPARDVVRQREGRLAALATLPFQQRTVAGMRPLDAVNGDGYKHNLFVVPPGGGAPIRPVTWAWQDVRTRRILAWRSGLTESADLLRGAFHDLAVRHGVPAAIYLDNTRAASAKWFGGPSHRWRKDREDVPSIMDLLKVDVHHTGVERTAGGKARGRGWAKPVERAYRDWDDYVDKHPRAAGAYTGRNPNAKPENHQGRALTWEEFLGVVGDGIARLNAKPGRDTEAAAGRSCDETWAEEIAETPVRRLTRSQRVLLLAAAETTQVGKDGTFRLQAGKGAGLPANRYHHEDLAAFRGRRVVVRFDADDLHDGVEVFDAAGRWLCRADCIAPVGFEDSKGSREWNRTKRRQMRHLDRAAGEGERLDELAERYGVGGQPAAATAPETRPKLVRMAPQDPKRPDVARKRALEERLARGLRKMGSA